MKNYQTFRKFFENSFDAMNGYIFIEVIFIAALGIASSKVEGLISSWTFIIVLSIIVLAFTYYKRYRFVRLFPYNLIESVQKDVEKKDLEIKISEYDKDKERNIVINNAISDTISGLNDHTCTLNTKLDPLFEVTEKLCDADVKEGLIKILTPFLREIYSIVQSHSVKITLGVYFEELAQVANDTRASHSLPILTIIKDENNLESIMPSNIIGDSSINGDLQKIQQIIERCIRNNRYLIQTEDLFEVNYNIACGPIPIACNEKQSTGALLIIIRGADLPNDLDRLLSIFSRILSNWIYKYNQCVYSKSNEVARSIVLKSTGEEIMLLFNGRFEIKNWNNEYNKIN